MDITCRKCEEPWDAYHLRHEMWWPTCEDHGDRVYFYKMHAGYEMWRHSLDRATCYGANHDKGIALEHDDYGQGTPPEVLAAADAWLAGKVWDVIPSVWVAYVAQGKGCPSCWSSNNDKPSRDISDFTELDGLEAATEGMIDLFG